MRKPVIIILVLATALLVPVRAEASHSLTVTTQDRAVLLSPTQVEVRGAVTCHGAAEQGSIGVVLIQPPSDISQDGGGSTPFACITGQTVTWALLVTANPGSTFQTGPARYSTFTHTQCSDEENDCPSDADDAELSIVRPSGPEGLTVDPVKLRFGTQPFGSVSKETVSMTNRGSRAVDVSVEGRVMPDDFSPGQPESSCPLAGVGVTLLLPGESCTHTVAFQPDRSFDQPERALVSVVARDLTGAIMDDRLIRITGRGA